MVEIKEPLSRLNINNDRYNKKTHPACYGEGVVNPRVWQFLEYVFSVVVCHGFFYALMYFCSRLFGLSRIVGLIRFSASIGLTTIFLKYHFLCFYFSLEGRALYSAQYAEQLFIQ